MYWKPEISPVQTKQEVSTQCELAVHFKNGYELEMLFRHPSNSCGLEFYLSFVCLFVCLGSATAFFPRGQLPKEDLRRPPSTTQATRHPRALCQCLFPLPPYFCLECLLHPVCTLPCPPVLYIYPIESLVCIPVLHIYSNPTGKNPSTYFKPHKQTVLIQYLNKRNN